MASRWRRAVEREPDRFPALPIWPFELSNGEFLPRDPTPEQIGVARLMLARSDEAARRVGMDRRLFLTKAGGVAASLAVINACSSGRPEVVPASTESSTSLAPSTTGSTTTSTQTTTSGEPGGTFEVPEPEEVEACELELGDQGEFIFDVHTHHVMPDGIWRQNAPRIESMIRGLAPQTCASSDRIECLDRLAYVESMFLASDTTVALLSDVPNSGPLDAPIPWEAKLGTADFAADLARAGHPRVLTHDVIAPNFGDLNQRLDAMTESASTGRVTAFKVYTAWGPDGQGYALDDPNLGLRVVEHARDLGVRVMCAHKGLPLLEFDRRFNGPADVVAVAAQYPDMDFVIYHGAYERETTEGPYDPDRSATGINSLIKAMDDHGISPNSNVYAELGTTWREVMRDPTEAAHTVGKLLSRVGENNLLWGTDAIWFGSPQAQIMAFRAFQISDEFQSAFGYPALTDGLKAKVFGRNAAAVFGIDADGSRCAIDEADMAQARIEFASYVDDGVVHSPYNHRGYVTRRDFLTALHSSSKPWSPI